MIFVGSRGRKNLCNLAFEGANYTAIESAATHPASPCSRKSSGFMCIAPALAAAALGEQESTDDRQRS